jgi:hypothetical protein
MAYALLTDLQAYVDSDTELPDELEQTRLLERASTLIDRITLLRIDPGNAEHVEAAKNAVIAQVEYWVQGGEDVDVTGPVQGYQIGSLQVQFGAGENRITPGRLAPRAKDALLMTGLLYRGGYEITAYTEY